MEKPATPNDIVKTVEAMARKDAGLAASLTAAWSRILDAIEARAKATRPLPRSFEVHHEIVTARLAFLTSLAGGHTVEQGEKDALAAIKIAEA